MNDERKKAFLTLKISKKKHINKSTLLKYITKMNKKYIAKRWIASFFTVARKIIKHLIFFRKKIVPKFNIFPRSNPIEIIMQQQKFSEYEWIFFMILVLSIQSLKTEPFAMISKGLMSNFGTTQIYWYR